MKKLVIALVCVGLLVALTIPSIYSAKWLTYNLEFSDDVKGTVEQCSARQRFISSSSIDEYRPTLTLSKTFKTLKEDYSGEHDGLYLDLNEHNGDITMQFFFIDKEGEKVQLNVYGGKLYGKWLSTDFKIIFNDADAKITPTKGKKFPPLWYGEVDITIECLGVGE